MAAPCKSDSMPIAHTLYGSAEPLTKTETKTAITSMLRLFLQAYESPLLVCVAAGSVALPTLLKLASKVVGPQQHEFKTAPQLTVPLELGKEFIFHSTFACPVSREQSTAENPPKMLPCGHVLASQSIFKIARGNTRTFKCPYCPAEATPQTCREIHFPDLVPVA